MSRLSHISLIPLLLALSACSAPKSSHSKAAPTDNQGQNTPQEPTEKKIYASLFQINFTENQKPNSYQMHISWPGDIGRISLQYGQGNQKSDVYTFDNTTSFDADISGGVPVDIEVKSLEENSLVGFSVNTPEDLEVKSHLELDKNTYWSYNRIYFYQGGTVVTHSFDLSINTKSIIIDKKVTSDQKLYQIITTENPAPHNVENPKEYAGSNIVIHAQAASGVLRVGMIGIDGEPGLAGSAISPVPTTPDPSLNGADGIPGISTKKYKIGFYKCVQQPGNGKNGKPGAPGRNGEDGKSGGNTGNLAVVIADNQNLQLIIKSKAGAPGLGGKGAPGNPGGHGGKAGALDTKKKCTPAHNGAAGPRGPQGKTGASGKAGAVGTFEYSGIKNVRVE